ncbi:family 65 glycosyl hydrolase [Mycobacterium sp. MYCO198283]|uniref:glycoside hydrolase family 65 protein n=1 Tax=Mycobacterium sp. MYCO198283 TaxID=2883505 RepID=UPI001E2898DB|nr:glycosyl hydrolase family 65 protein [Mycobacterium sp. MYCO198283]MCG5433813.1 family 65 glycosyl hydrolase [Mycobacterium sp. MYCO198283]
MIINDPCFAVEPWCVRADTLKLDMLDEVESVFALSNGHIGWRANLDEGEPNGLPGTYLNGVWEQHPLPYAEGGYGYPELGQTVINVTNGKLIRLLVDDEPFDVRYGELHHHEFVLDFRDGVLRRRVEWTSPSGRTVRVTSTRLVSLVQRAVAAVHYEVEAVDGTARIVVQSELVANEAMPAAESGDPRVSKVLQSPLVPEDHDCHGLTAELVHRTRESQLQLACAMDHVAAGPADLHQECESYPDLARVTFTADLEPGTPLRLVKLVSYGWSSVRSMTGLRAQVAAALTGARASGWDGLLAEQRDFLDDFWQHADVEVDGDPEIQQAVRFALFHVLQAGARAEGRAIPAKGLTGSGYDGHTFWDTETFVLPVLTYTCPEPVANALRWRHSTLPLALQRAETLGLRGAAFPWRTIAGQECSGYWPAGTAAFHINADIADAVIRYLRATEDERFERDVAVDLLVHTARLWRSLGHHNGSGLFRIDGVTGPDEYSAVSDNNVFTNLMAQQNMWAAAEITRKHPDRARDLGVDDEERASWRDAADAMYIPYDDELGVHPQADNFTKHDGWDFANTPPDKYPLLLHYPYFDLYRRQVVKQADLVLAMHLRGDAFTAEQKARNFDYYERITVRDSSLSAATQSVLAAEVGHLDLAYAYLGEAAMMDLDNLADNTGHGLHMASLAGAWLALVAGLGGMRDCGGHHLSFAPRLPEQLTRLAFGLTHRGRRLRVEITHQHATYRLLDGDEFTFDHHGDQQRVTVEEPVTLPIPAPPKVQPVRPPVHREPRRGNCPPC